MVHLLHRLYGVDAPGVTSTSSALGVLNDYALYKSTHSLTHSCRVFPKDCPLPSGLSLLLLQKLAFLRLPVRPMQVLVLAMTQCLCLSVSVVSRCSVETDEPVELVFAMGVPATYATLCCNEILVLPKIRVLRILVVL